MTFTLTDSNEPIIIQQCFYEVGDSSNNRFEICIQKLTQNATFCRKRITSMLLLLPDSCYMQIPQRYLNSNAETRSWRNPKPYLPTELSKMGSLPSCCKPVRFWRWWHSGHKYEVRIDHCENACRMRPNDLSFEWWADSYLFTKWRFLIQIMLKPWWANEPLGNAAVLNICAQWK